jgi:thioester reductase-like protein
LVLEGDLADRELGLGTEEFTWLANWASVIFHLGVDAGHVVECFATTSGS